jgi:hypothetical protein
VLVSVLVGVLSGCVAIKEQEALQRAPGVVALRLKICVNDKDKTRYDQCIPPTNTAENDNGQDIVLNPPLNGSAQLMVGFRIPDGTTAPPSFQNSDGRLSFAASPGYASALTAEYVPLAGFHWVGYLSTGVQLDGTNANNFLITINPEFGLNGVGGAPFTGPFRWRAVIGTRVISDAAPGSSPISCPLGNQYCFDSPTLSSTTARVNLPHLATTLPVSDFSVRPPEATAAGPGEVATLTYKLTSQDAHIPAFGAPTLTLKASTTLPGGQPQLGPTTIAIPRNGDTTAPVSLLVPPGTPIGTYDVVLTATGNSLPAGADIPKSATGKLTVVDKTAPAVRVSSPGDTTYTVGQRVTADYGCTDETGGSGVSTCTGPVPSGSPIDTSSPGAKSFAVSGTDAAGNAASVTRTYTVVAPSRVVVAGAQLVHVNVTLSFLFPSAAASTKFTLLQVKGVPSGSTVVATCKGGGCPTKKVKGKKRNVVFTKKNAAGTVTLSPFRNRALRAGAVLTVTVTKPGSFGMVKKLTVKRNKRPTLTTSCLSPDSKATAPCSS